MEEESKKFGGYRSMETKRTTRTPVQSKRGKKRHGKKKGSEKGRKKRKKG